MVDVSGTQRCGRCCYSKGGALPAYPASRHWACKKAATRRPVRCEQSNRRNRWWDSGGRTVEEPEERLEVFDPVMHSEAENALFVRKTLRSGQVVEAAQSVVVYGDVNRGSSITSDGDIIVWGRLLGEAHAGAGGDRDAIITALQMAPSQLRIADCVAYGPSEKSTDSPPEVAAVYDDGRIHIAAACPDSLQPGGVNSREAMTSAQREATFRAAITTAAYAGIIGTALLVAPYAVFGLLFDTADVAAPWIRIGGLLLALLGVYYAAAAQGEVRGLGVKTFYQATVWGRLAVMAVCLLLVVRKLVEPSLLLFGLMNLYGAASMAWALRARSRADPSSSAPGPRRMASGTMQP